MLILSLIFFIISFIILYNIVLKRKNIKTSVNLAKMEEKEEAEEMEEKIFAYDFTKDSIKNYSFEINYYDGIDKCYVHVLDKNDKKSITYLKDKNNDIIKNIKNSNEILVEYVKNNTFQINNYKYATNYQNINNAKNAINVIIATYGNCENIMEYVYKNKMKQCPICYNYDKEYYNDTTKIVVCKKCKNKYYLKDEYFDIDFNLKKIDTKLYNLFFGYVLADKNEYICYPSGDCPIRTREYHLVSIISNIIFNKNYYVLEIKNKYYFNSKYLYESGFGLITVKNYENDENKQIKGYLFLNKRGFISITNDINNASIFYNKKDVIDFYKKLYVQLYMYNIGNSGISMFFDNEYKNNDLLSQMNKIHNDLNN